MLVAFILANSGWQICVNFTFASGNVMVNETAMTAELKEQVGTINGASATLAATFRCIGPALAEAAVVGGSRFWHGWRTVPSMGRIRGFDDSEFMAVHVSLTRLYFSAMTGALNVRRNDGVKLLSGELLALTPVACFGCACPVSFFWGRSKTTLPCSSRVACCKSSGSWTCRLQGGSRSICAGHRAVLQSIGNPQRHRMLLLCCPTFAAH